jgi:hypothetical protein
MSSTNRTSRAGKPSPKQLQYLRYLAAKTGTSFTYPQTLAEAGQEIDRLQQLAPESHEDIDRERRATADDMATKRGDEARVHEHELTGYGSSATWADTWTDETPRVVHCMRERYDVYVGRGRGSRWGNPFKEGRDGTRQQVIAKYERWLRARPELMARLPELRGKVLGCWCAPKPCHADVLLRLANEPQKRDRQEPQQNGEPHAMLGYTIPGERRLIVVQRVDGLIRAEDHSCDGSGKRYLVAEGLKTCGELDSLLADYQSQAARLGAIPAQVEAVDALVELAL